MVSELHYTIPELAKLWHVDKKTVQRWFRDEPDVLCFGHAESVRVGRKLVRSYLSLRVSETVAARVYARMLIKKKS